MAAALYGPGHPYGYVELGTEASNKAITRDAMVGSGNGAWFLAMRLSSLSARSPGANSKPLATKAFSGWAGKPPSRSPMPAPHGTSAKVIIVDTPGAAQTQVRVASLGVARSAPDFEAVELMNTILGGLFTSRINLNLREDKGYTYGAFSTFAARREPGPYFMSAPFAPTRRLRP